MSGFKLSEDSSKPKITESLQPVGLTIHSMPTPEILAKAEAERTVRGRWKMLLIMLICAAPVIASYFTYYVIKPTSLRNFGELIEPQRPLPDLAATGLDGQTIPLRELKGQWLLVSVGSGSCPEACVQQLYFQRQLRESLGKEKDRLDRVWLLTDDAPIPVQLQEGLHQATVLRVSADAVAQWLIPAAGHAINEHLYLVDPKGNWMLRFSANLDLAGAAKAKRDLDRLLRANVSWDQPGR
jgi:hypothetical protein